jgi:hypothetical protein
VGSDLRNSGVEGKRTMQVRFVNWYLGKYFQAAQYDGALARKFLEVANSMEQPAALMSPAVALSVWKRNRQPAPTSVTRWRQKGPHPRRRTAHGARDYFLFIIKLLDQLPGATKMRSPT